MYTNILLPVAYDPKTQLEAPLAVAKTLAAQGAHMTVVHVMELLPNYVVEYLPPDSLGITRHEILKKMEDAAKDLPNSKCVILDGHAGRMLSDYAVNHDIDLVVMPSHQPEMGDVIWGSTAAYVVRHVPCAVHVVR
ncbi:MAG: universal stress protein [Paracoccaceae bacterium]